MTCIRTYVLDTRTNGVFHHARVDSSSTGRYDATTVSFGKEEEGTDGILKGVEVGIDVVGEAKGGPDGPVGGSSGGTAGDTMGDIFHDNAEVILNAASGPRGSH